MISRSMRSQGTEAMSNQQIKLAVSDVLDYAQKTDYAVQKVLRNGCSENEVSFESPLWGHTDYEHSPAANDACKVFGPSGGKLQWRGAPDYAQSGQTWMFNKHIAITGIGEEPPAASSPYGGELVMVLPIKSKELCMAINDNLGIPNYRDHGTYGTKPPYDSGAIESYQPFDGTFSATVTFSGSANEFAGKSSGCATKDNAADSPNGPYAFFYTLIAR